MSEAARPAEYVLDRSDCHSDQQRIPAGSIAAHAEAQE